MFTTASLLDIQQIVALKHRDPHHVLGMHEVSVNGKDCLAARAFVPQAKSIRLIDSKNPEASWQMEKIHLDGFFEAVIRDRSEWFRYRLIHEGYNGEVWESYDPYSFFPLISELDTYLFAQGTHYKIYDKLGAHPMEVDGVSGVLFGLWAPNALCVSVIGDFNNWDGRRHAMRILRGSGVWEIFIPGLSIMDKYKFEIQTSNGDIIEKSDPYGNYFELQPSSSAHIYDLNKYKWKDSKWLKKREDEGMATGPVNVYEVHAGSWRRKSDGHFLTYGELAKELIPYVKDMGYTHIELMPLQEYPFDGSWGYQTTGYYSPTSRYGSPDEFMAFIDACHRQGIGVILDWVPAHFPKDSHALARFDGTHLYEYEDPRMGEHPHWGTLVFNYSRNEVKNFLIGNAFFWINKYHIDGLRVDAVASMLYLDYGREFGQWLPNRNGGRDNIDAIEFIKHLNSIVKQYHPSVMMIAEESTAWAGVSRPTEDGGLGFSYKWNMGWMNDFLAYMATDPIHRKYHHGNLTFSMMYAYTENFILPLSHDEVVHGKKSLIDKMPGDTWQKFANLRLSLGFMYGHPGKKLLFMGGEFGQFAEWSEKKPLDWYLLDYDHHRQLKQYIHDLNHLYLNEKPLWIKDYQREGFEWIECDDVSTSTVSFYRTGSGERDIVIFLCNFSSTPQMNYRMGLPFAGRFKEVLNSDSRQYGGSGIVNETELESEKVECNKRKNSLVLKVPPLGTIVLKSC